MLERREFFEMVRGEIVNYVPEDMKTSRPVLKEFVKSNDRKLTGLVLEGAKSEACPIVYLNEYYEQYAQGLTYEEVMHCITEFILGAKLLNFEKEEISLTKESIKDKVAFYLVDSKLNEDYLKDKVFKEMQAGLSLVYGIAISDDGRAMLKYQMLEDAGYSEADLYKDAMNNMVMKNPPVMNTITEMLFGLNKKNLLEESELPCKDDLYVLTNESQFGASTLFYDGILEKIAKLLDSSFYVLPASVHEILVTADNGAFDAESLKQTVADVNATMSPEDVLSHSLFRYDKDDKVLERI